MPPAGCGSRRWRSEMATTATRVAGTAAVVEARRRLADRDGFLAWAFLLPSVVYIVALVAVPFFLAIGFALSDVTAGDPSYNFVGLANFRAIFHDPVFWRSLGNTFIFTTISMALIVVLGKVLANILVANFRGKWLVRMLVLLPWTTPVTLSAISWLWLLDSIYSPIDWVLRHLGLLGSPGALLGPDTNQYWLGEPDLAMGSVIAVHVWRLTPLAAVIMMAGLAAHVRGDDPAHAAGHRGSRAVRCHLHLHRYGRGRRAHRRRPEQRHPGAHQLGVPAWDQRR